MDKLEILLDGLLIPTLSQLRGINAFTLEMNEIREDGGGTRYLCGGNCPRESTDTPNNFLTTIAMRKSTFFLFLFL